MELAIKSVLGVGFLVCGFFPTCAASGPSGLNQVQVSIFNASPVDWSTLERAEQEAGRVLQDAGVQVVWVNCRKDAQRQDPPGACSEAVYPSHLHLKILQMSRGVKAATVGISFLAQDGRGCYADLFYEPVRQLQEETQTPPAVILGHAMAHELGHLLLGMNSHSASGLMRANWRREDLSKALGGRLLFSSEESLKIRRRLAEPASIPSHNFGSGVPQNARQSF